MSHLIGDVEPVVEDIGEEFCTPEEEIARVGPQVIVSNSSTTSFAARANKMARDSAIKAHIAEGFEPKKPGPIIYASNATKEVLSTIYNKAKAHKSLSASIALGCGAAICAYLYFRSNK